MSKSIDQIILEFLQERPVGWKADAFVRWCVAEFQVRLRYFKRAGYRLPIELTDSPRGLENLAIEITGFYLAVEGGEQYGIIFKYLRNHGIKVFCQENIGEVKSLLRRQMFVFAKRQSTDISGMDDHEGAKLKRRIRESLALLHESGEICRDQISGNKAFINCASINGQVFGNEPLIPYRDFIDMVDRAYYEASSEQEICRTVLKLLSEQDQYHKRIHEHDLVAAIFTVVARNAHDGTILPSALPSQTQQLLHQEFSKGADIVLEATVRPMLENYCQKGSICAEDAPRLLEAIRLFFEDLCNCSDNDLWTRYFYGQMPVEAHGDYLKKFKNVFEYTIKMALEGFFDGCRNNSTIRRIWGYR